MHRIVSEELPKLEEPVANQKVRALAVARRWRKILDIGLVLWVIRVPLASAIVGLLLLGLTPQAQDLFADNQGTIHSILFFVLLTAVWAIPLHYSARLLLDHDERLQQRRTRTENGVSDLDWFESRLARLRDSWRDALTRLGRFGPFRALGWLALIPVRIVDVLLWRPLKKINVLVALPGLNADEKRRLRAGQWTCLEYAEHVMPRILGCSAFLAVVFGLSRAALNLPESDNTDVLRSAQQSIAVFGIGALISFGVFQIYVGCRHSLTWKFEQWSARFGVSSGVVYLFLLWLFSVVIVVTGAAATAEMFGRVLAVPIILGGWLPFLTMLSHYGRKRGFPFIVASLLLVAGLTLVVGDNHTVRRLRTLLPSAPYDEGALDLEVAVHLWKTANDCGKPQSTCPRPIIVAAAGGASRAGFYTAGAIGHLIHQTSPEKLDATRVRNRLFAISGVSGGSVGAAVTVAALKAAGSDGTPPCKNLGQSTQSTELWFGERISNWRDCLEALLAGDFLTPIAIGGAFHDVLRFGWWDDRAALLERSWEDRFRDITRNGSGAIRQCGGLACPFLDFGPNHDFWLPLLILNGTSVHTGRRIVTTPLHVEYSHPLRLDPEKMQKDPCPNGRARAAGQTGKCRLFAETYRFHQIINDDTKPDRDLGWFRRSLAEMQRWFVAEFWTDFWSAPWPFYDVRLSTAAHNSARFPVISPVGAVRNREHQVADRIVDGGYFENYGAVSALELARAIRHIDGNLRPFVVVISNDPEVPIDLEAVISHDRAVKLHKISGLLHVDAADANFATGITGPIATFANTRTARGTLAVEQLRTELDGWLGSGSEPSLAHLRTIPQFYKSNKVKPVSMSWWMSKPIQARLHQQIECEYNYGQVVSILRVLGAREPESRQDPCSLERLEKY